MMAILLLVVIGGCGFPIKPEPMVFVHDDEIVRRGEFVVLADRRIFTMMAFLNATGYDLESDGVEMHPVRVRVRRMLREKEVQFPDKFREWKKYYKRKPYQICVYIDFTLSLSTDYPFRRIRPYDELGFFNTIFLLADFPEVLNDFWETTDLETIWAKVKPDYVAEIGYYDIDEMERTLPFIWQYLRMQRKDSSTIVHVPNLLEAHYAAYCVRYEDYIFSVESPGSNTKGFNIHEYLHTFVNDIVKEHYHRYARKLRAYYPAGKDEKLSDAYPEAFTIECLVRALDRRMRILLTDDPATKRKQENIARDISRQGLTLTYPFFQCLSDFEKSNLPFDEFLPQMLEILPEFAPKN
jgi:hypothetical protein